MSKCISPGCEREAEELSNYCAPHRRLKRIPVWKGHEQQDRERQNREPEQRGGGQGGGQQGER
jgi:hypothetical protein